MSHSEYLANKICINGKSYDTTLVTTNDGAKTVYALDFSRDKTKCRHVGMNPYVGTVIKNLCSYSSKSDTSHFKTLTSRRTISNCALFKSLLLRS